MESEAGQLENGEKKNKTHRQKKNRIGRETDSVWLHLLRRITLSSSERVQAERNLPERHV